MPYSDPDFFQYATSGDEVSFRVLVMAHLPMVQAVASRTLGEHSHLASDVAQAVFTRLARLAKHLPSDLIVASWLHRQTVRLAIDSVRRETRRRIRENIAAMLQTHDPSPTPPLWQQTAPLLDDALDRLSAKDRAVLVMRYLEDRDFAAVGEAVGSTPEAARKRVSRSLEKLRSLLGRRGVALSLAALTAVLGRANSQAASAPTVSLISKKAVASAASVRGVSVVVAMLTTNAAALIFGAALAWVVAGWTYFQREKEFAIALRQQFQPPNVSVISKTPGRLNPWLDTEPSTLPEIIEALEILTAGPNHRFARLRIDALLRKISPEQYLEFLITAEPLIPKLRWRSILNAAEDQWHERDPGALVQALFASDIRKGTEIRTGQLLGHVRLNIFEITSNIDGGQTGDTAFHYLFEEWLARDFKAAEQWLESQAETAPMQVKYPGVSKFFDLLARSAASKAPPNFLPGKLQMLAESSSQPAEIYASAVKGRIAATGNMSEAFGTAQNAFELRVIGCQFVRDRQSALR